MQLVSDEVSFEYLLSLMELEEGARATGFSSRVQTGALGERFFTKFLGRYPEKRLEWATGLYEGKIKLDQEIFEWLDMVTVILLDPGPLVFVEAGAGYGRWSSRFFRAATLAGKKVAGILLLEPKFQHTRWAIQNRRLNGVPRSVWKVKRCALGGKSGWELLYSKMPEAGIRTGSTESWFGQSLVRAAQGLSSTDDISKPWAQWRLRMSGWSVELVRVRTLASEIEGLGIVTLLDFDVQGSEFEIIEASIDEINLKVKMMHISTHSAEVETNLRHLLRSHGWALFRDFASNSEVEVGKFGKLRFRDGTQSWANLRFWEAHS
ncbi:hypothetical protein N9M74_00830 [Pontimonas sp.]|nr:hypothetical protein [Pontimonas sp.]